MRFHNLEATTPKVAVTNGTPGTYATPSTALGELEKASARAHSESGKATIYAHAHRVGITCNTAQAITVTNHLVRLGIHHVCISDGIANGGRHRIEVSAAHADTIAALAVVLHRTSADKKAPTTARRYPEGPSLHIKSA